MTLEEALLKIEELEQDVATLNATLDAKNDRLIDDVDRLTDIENEYDELTETVSIFRDPSNWNGTHFCPVLTYLQTDSPYDLLK